MLLADNSEALQDKFVHILGCTERYKYFFFCITIPFQVKVPDVMLNFLSYSQNNYLSLIFIVRKISYTYKMYWNLNQIVFFFQDSNLNDIVLSA